MVGWQHQPLSQLLNELPSNFVTVPANNFPIYSYNATVLLFWFFHCSDSAAGLEEALKTLTQSIHILFQESAEGKNKTKNVNIGLLLNTRTDEVHIVMLISLIFV